MSNCLTCGGLIMEPNTSYGYAGKVCFCLVEPKIQKPANLSPELKEQLKGVADKILCGGDRYAFIEGFEFAVKLMGKGDRRCCRKN